jgi:plasmid replication initiation protein
MKEIVKYSNELNKVNFSSLKETQLNVLFTILAKIRHENTKDGITIPTKELFELADINNGGGYRANLLSSLGVLQDFKIQYTYERNSDKNATAQEVIFPRLQIYDDKNGEVLNVKVSEAFRERYLKAMPQFTRFELEEFVNLSGTYAKTIYRFLKQYRQTGVWRVKYKDFIELLGIPESYRATNIDQQILKPVIKQLSTERNLFDLRRIPFKGLMVRKIKSGKFIEALEFCFIPQPVSALEKDERQHERNLTTIANDIQREQELRKLKKAAPKTHPITGKEIDETQEYLGRYLRIHNDKLGLTDMLKIEKIEKSGEQLEVFLRNVDDDFRSSMRFDSFKHFKNTFERYGD